MRLDSIVGEEDLLSFKAKNKGFEFLFTLLRRFYVRYRSLHSADIQLLDQVQVHLFCRVILEVFSAMLSEFGSEGL